MVSRAGCVALALQKLGGGIMPGGDFFDGQRRMRTRIGFQLRDIGEVNRVVMDHQPRDVVVPAHRIHVGRGNGRFARRPRTRSVSKPIAINARDDGFRDGHRAGRSFVADVVAIFGDARSDNPPAILEHNGVGGRRRHDQQQKRCNGRCATHTKFYQAGRRQRARSFPADALSNTGCTVEQVTR